MKVCPRCSYVDIEGRRVCAACRRSLMGTPERDLVSVLEQREAALSGDESMHGHAPWGPGLSAMVERALGEVAGNESVAVEAEHEAPTSVPSATRTPVDARVSMFGDTEVIPPAYADAQVNGAGAAHGATVFTEMGPDLREVEREARQVDDLAEVTRQQLAKMYDARLGAPVLMEVDGATNGPRFEPEKPKERRPPNLRRRKAIAVVVLLALAFFGLKFLRGSIGGEGAARAADPTTPVERLPWAAVRLGELELALPTKAAVATDVESNGHTSHYERFDLPDITISITMRGPNPLLTGEAALREYAGQLADPLGARVQGGQTLDLRFATAYNAALELPDSRGYLYIVVTRDEVVEVRGDVIDPNSARVDQIWEQVINSVNPV